MLKIGCLDIIVLLYGLIVKKIVKNSVCIKFLNCLRLQDC